MHLSSLLHAIVAEPVTFWYLIHFQARVMSSVKVAIVAHEHQLFLLRRALRLANVANFCKIAIIELVCIWVGLRGLGYIEKLANLLGL